MLGVLHLCHSTGNHSKKSHGLYAVVFVLSVLYYMYHQDLKCEFIGYTGIDKLGSPRERKRNKLGEIRNLAAKDFMT